MKRITSRLESFPFCHRLLTDKRYRTLTVAVFSLILNLLYAFYNGVLGLLTGSVWFGATCCYYLLLIAMRFGATLWGGRKASRERGAAVWIGLLITLTGLMLGFIHYISLSQNTATRHGMIPMITIATYTFVKIALAIRRGITHRQDPSPLLSAIRAIGYTEVLVSLLTMQRSMLVSFGGTDAGSALLLNAFTGGGVCVLTVGMGIRLIKRYITKGT